MGIFGGIGRALTKPGENSGLSFADRLAIFGTAYSGDMAGARELRDAPAKRAELQRMQDLARQGAGLFQPVPGQMRQVGVGNDAGEDITAAFAPQMEQGPSRQRTPQEMAQGLAELEGQGGDMRQFRPLAEMFNTKPDRPQVVEGVDGIRERQPDGSWKMVAPYARRDTTVPMGMKRNPETGRLEWDDGYLDAQIALTGGRRDQIVSRPMPRVGGGGGRSGGGGRKAPPSGFIVDP